MIIYDNEDDEQKEELLKDKADEKRMKTYQDSKEDTSLVT